MGTHPLVASVTEKQLSQWIFDAARRLGWKVYRYPTWRPTGTTPGFPDLVLIKPPRILFRELKRAGKVMTAHQEACRAELRACGLSCEVWRTSDWYSGLIERELMG